MTRTTRTAALLLALPFCALAQESGAVRMNQVQVTGSHNSYKQRMDPALFTFLRSRWGERLDGIDYTHQPIDRQLYLGLRALEIDVVSDPDGGLYAHPAGLDIERTNKLAGAPYDPDAAMRQPGLKVMHIPDIDFRSNAYTLQDELAMLKKWSDARPRHLPIVVTMNAKDDPLEAQMDGITLTVPRRFDAAAFDAWDAELLRGLGRARLITPDDVRGHRASLEEAALAHAWPKLDQARGKFLFVLDEEGAKRTTYIPGHPSLAGRVMFVNMPEGHNEAAFRIVNEPQKDWAYIQFLVRSGYYVRTRADADTVEARKNDRSRQRAALLSGAQIVSTDYYIADPKTNPDYQFLLTPRWNALLLPVARPLPALEP